MNRQLRLLPALLVAVAVILVSIAGSATAAKLITGKQVKNGTITTLDIRNNNLTGADVKNGTVSGADLANGSVTGTDLADGAVDRDALAVDTRITAGLANGADVDIPNCPDQTLQVCPTLAVVQETGPMAVTMTGTLENADGSVPTPTRCGLYRDGLVTSVAKFSPAAEGQPGDVIPFTLQATAFVDEPTDRPELRCTQFAGDDLRITGLRTMVIQVHTLD